ncbi:hypothetical protein BC2230_40640 [Burkholderia cepacia]
MSWLDRVRVRHAGVGSLYRRGFTPGERKLAARGEKAAGSNRAGGQAGRGEAKSRYGNELDG